MHPPLPEAEAGAAHERSRERLRAHTELGRPDLELARLRRAFEHLHGDGPGSRLPRQDDHVAHHVQRGHQIQDQPTAQFAAPRRGHSPGEVQQQCGQQVLGLQRARLVPLAAESRHRLDVDADEVGRLGERHAVQRAGRDPEQVVAPQMPALALDIEVGGARHDPGELVALMQVRLEAVPGIEQVP